MQSKALRKRPLWVLGAWLGSGLCSLLDAPPTLARPKGEVAPPADAVSGPLPTKDAASRIRSLGTSARPDAWSELANLSLSADVTGQAGVLLLAVRTLARAPTDRAVERALKHHLLTKTTGDSPALRELVRATAAQALASRHSHESLATLLLLASGPAERDPGLQAIAREAIVAHLPKDEAIDRALPWLDVAARRAQLGWIDDERKTAQQRQRERCTVAERDLPRLADIPPRVAATTLATLASCPETSGRAAAELAKLAPSSPTWALRGMAALGLGRGDSSWQARARSALASGDAVVRSAAAWFLAVESAEASERLARDGRPEVQAAATNQRAVSRREPAATAQGCPPALRSESTSLLFQRFARSTEEDGPMVLGCLAGRLQKEPGPGLTAGELDSLTLGSPAAQRLLVASGLGDANPEGREIARGLAQRLYARESDGYVRRFLCLSLAQLGLGRGERLSHDLRIDPDPVCRAVGRGSAGHAAGTKTLSTVTTHEWYLAVRAQAPPVWLEPAPDGFVGARIAPDPSAGTASEDFVDCRETGSPAWACGPPGLTPTSP